VPQPCVYHLSRQVEVKACDNFSATFLWSAGSSAVHKSLQNLSVKTSVLVSLEGWKEPRGRTERLAG